jgi:hypothetical protein
LDWKYSLCGRDQSLSLASHMYLGKIEIIMLI